MRIEPLEDRHILAIFMVTNLNDAGAGSLRQAIMDSNDAAGPDEIEFDDTVVGTIDLTSWELWIRDDLTINGPGADRLTIDANDRSLVFQVLDGIPGNPGTHIRVVIAGLTITGGMTRDDDGGGGIWNEENLTVTDSVISGNTAGSLGGGGIYSIDGDLTVINSTISGNTADRNGGGIQVHGEYISASVTVINSTISGNTGSGIGVYTYATGVSVNVTDSTISGNTGSGIFASSYGSDTQVDVTNSTISGNGIGVIVLAYRSRMAVTVTNSTISGSTGSGIIARPGYGSGSVTVINSTISGNGRGIHARNRYDEGDPPSVTLTGSILSGNSLDDSVPNDIGGPPFPFDANHSLLGLAAAALVDTGSDNIADDNPQLAPLADNGGPTQTHALLPGSPAIDAGDPDAVAGENDVPLFDQRGAPFARVVNDRIDIGAYEHSPSTPPADLTGDGFVDFDDLTILLAHWDQRVSAALGNLVDPLTTPVNFQDLTLLLAAWTGPGPVGAASPQAAAVMGSGDESEPRREGRMTDSVLDAAGDGVVMLKHNLRAARRAAWRSRPAGGIYRLQATAVDRAMGEEEFPSLRRARRLTGG